MLVLTLPVNITNKLKEHKAKLDLLLSKKAKVNLIGLNMSEKILLISNVLFYGKVKSKMQVPPLKFAIRFQKASTFTILYISTTCKRPSSREFDERIVLKKTNCVINYNDKHKGELFANEHIYFSFESSKDIIFTINCSFGKLETKKRNNEPSKNKDRTNLLTYRNIDAYIKEIVSSEEEMKACQDQAAIIIKKRKKKSLQLSNNVDILLRNKELTTSRLTFKDREEYRKLEEQKALRKEELREQLESRIALRKFLSAYKHDVTRLIVSIYNTVG